MAKKAQAVFDDHEDMKSYLSVSPTSSPFSKVCPFHMKKHVMTVMFTKIKQ